MIKKHSTFVIVFLAISVLPACDWFSQKASVPVRLRLVNVLDSASFKDAHIKGNGAVESINVQMQELAKRAGEWDKTVPVVAYCSNYFCMASGDAAEKLTELGFTDVYAYEAGMAEWYRLSLSDKSYEVEGPAEKPYLKITVKQPKKEPENIRVISSQELQKMIKEANMLDEGVNQ